MYQSASISNKILHAPWTLVKKVMNFAYRDRTQWCTKTWFWIVTSNLRPRTQLQVYDFWKNKVNFSLAYRHRDKQISFLIFSQWTTEIFHIDTNTLWMNVFTIKRQEKKKKKKRYLGYLLSLSLAGLSLCFGTVIPVPSFVPSSTLPRVYTTPTPSHYSIPLFLNLRK